MTHVNVNIDDVSHLSLDDSSRARYIRVCELLPTKGSTQLARFLEESGNREQALLQLEVLLQRHPSQAKNIFEDSSLALRACLVLFGASQWLGQTLLHNPDLLEFFSTPSKLISARWADANREELRNYCQDSNVAFSAQQLARFKRREYVRIFTRELLGLASIAEVATEISSLSDALVDRALSHCQSQMRALHGWPKVRASRGVRSARFSVLALGKLGGNELNYSSDIDLLYLFDDGDQSGIETVPAREFFTQLAQQLTSVLCTASAEGQIFRVDLRLRPQGSSGEIVTGLSQALRYYRETAHDWELQALLKLRHCAGDHSLAREFITQVQELIYRKKLSLSVIQTAARSLERIRVGNIRPNAHELDVKNDAGGIREIEFAVQCLQRVHGGVEKWLRSSGTLFALQKLYDKAHIGDAEFRELFNTYCVLRAIEHRVQCRHGVQSHRLPARVSEQQSLLRSLGLESVQTASDMRQLMTSASSLCARVLSLGKSHKKMEVAAHSVNIGTPGAAQLSRELASRSSVLASVLAEDVGTPTLRSLQRYIAAASTSQNSIHAALENLAFIEGALPVLEQSNLATDIVSRHPEDIKWLFQDSPRDESVPISDQLRMDARRAMLRSVGRTILEDAPVWQVLGEYTKRFDELLQRAFLAINPPSDFALFVVGRFATCELDVMSDADLVFVRESASDGDRSEHCARALVEMLSSYTREGTVIAVDTRLRPHGSEGELVVSSRQLAQYFQNEAKSWETLAFGKLRYIAGSRTLADSVAAAIQQLQHRFAASTDFVRELRAMRMRLANSGGPQSFKTGPGGLYDLDFVVGLLEAKAGLAPAGKQLRDRLQRLVDRGCLNAEHGRELLLAVDTFRRVDHAIRIVEGRSRAKLPESDATRECVAKLAACPDLKTALANEMRKVRAIFECFFGV